MKNFLNPEEHQNCIDGSKVTTILLKGWILLIGGVASRRVCACSLRIAQHACSFTICSRRHWWQHPQQARWHRQDKKRLGANSIKISQKFLSKAKNSQKIYYIFWSKGNKRHWSKAKALHRRYKKATVWGCAF